MDTGMPLSTDLDQIADALFAATPEGRGKFQGEFVNANLILAHCVGADQIITTALVGLDIRTDYDVGDGGGPAGIKITSAGIYGYSGGTTKEFYLEAATGKGMAAGGKVILDASGISIKGAYCSFYSETPKEAGTIYGTDGVIDGILMIHGLEGIQIDVDPGFSITFNSAVQAGTTLDVFGETSFGDNVDFLTHQAISLVLENRTDDPAGVLGQIWFRTDL
jgi:hypothetical protein